MVLICIKIALTILRHQVNQMKCRVYRRKPMDFNIRNRYSPIGLHLNSTAFFIGAMLESLLIGPVMD